MPDQLQTIVQRMIDAGESEDNIGTVIQHFKANAPQPIAANEPDTFTGGAVKGLKDYAGEIGPRITSGFLRAINPLAMVKDFGHAISEKDAADHGGIMQPGPPLRAQIPALVANAPEMAGGMLGGAALGGVARGVGAGLVKVAPKAMDMGLQRTMAQRLEFPNTPKRLVDEGIVPRGKNVQNALTATEGKINADAKAFDAPRLTGPGAPIPPPLADPRDIAQSAQQFANTEGRIPALGNVPGPEAAELNNLGKDYLAQNTRPRGLQETIDQKRAFQMRANYPSRPNAPAVSNNALNFNKGIAGANRDEAIRMHPPIAGDLAKEQDLIGADVAQKYMDAKSTPLSSVGTLKTALMLRNPTVMGSSAIAADRLGQLLKNPALIRALVLSRLSQEPP